MDGPEVELFERSLRNATTSHTGAELDAALRELGWHDALLDDIALAVSLLFECQGAANTTSSALDDVLRVALGVEASELAVVLPALGRWDPPGSLADGRLSVEGLCTARLSGARTALVATGDATTALVRPCALVVHPVEGMDPRFGLSEIRGTIGRSSWTPSAGNWPVAACTAQLAVGHELVGAAGAMLDLACTHARERVQFGRPIAAFQAVRHRLAETLVAVEGARALLETAWEDPAPATVFMAKAVAGRAARTAARHCQQVLAGMGFTTEHPLHRYVRRVLVLEQLFGSTRTLTRAVGAEVIAKRTLPVPLAL